MQKPVIWKQSKGNMVPWWLRTCCAPMKENRLFRTKNIQFVTALNQIKCLKHIRWQRLLLTCAPISELPSNIGTMSGTKKGFYNNLGFLISLTVILFLGSVCNIWFNNSNDPYNILNSCKWIFINIGIYFP